ncbi:hypothetical protein JCM3765_002013 [Sporobolomyces pararoseus]
MPLLRKRKKEPPHPSSTQATASIPPLPTAASPQTLPPQNPSTSVGSEKSGTDGQPPRSFAELEDLVQEVVSGSWDPSISISSWRRALSQLAQEAKVYYNENNVDLAFVRTATVLKLASQVLPRYHPDWHSLSPAQKVDIAKLASDYSQNYEALKHSLLSRSAAYYASVRATQGSNFNPALSLRNTVQPSSMSMTDSGKSEEYYRSLMPNSAVAEKKGKGTTGPKSNKLRKAFGMRGRTQSQKSAGSSKDLEGMIKTHLPAPGTEEKEGEWEIVKAEKSLNSHDHFFESSTPVSQGSTTPVNTNNLPLPGEDDSDVEYEDDNRTSITFANSAPIPPTPDWSQLPSAYAPNPNLQATHSPSTYTYTPSQYPHFSNPPHQQFSHLAESMPNPRSSYSQPADPQPDPQQRFSQPPTPPIRPPLPPTPPLFRPQSAATSSSSSSTTPAWQNPSMPPPRPPVPPLPPQLAPAPTPVSTPFSIPATASAPPESERSASVDTSLSRLTPFIPPTPSAPPSDQIYSPSTSSQYSRSRGYSESIVSPSSTPSLHRSSSIASVPPELYQLQTRRRSSTRSTLGGTGANRGNGLSNLHDIGEALPDHSGSEKARSVEEEEGGTWLAQTEGGNPLRPMFLPARLISYFVDVIARANTEKNIETCGLLLGHLSHNEFTITTLLLPKQDGTPDTCVTTHEEEQFEFQDSRGLMTLGWIHTHPTQSTFLSSVDLHTHASYQIMLQEAIAIVCAPRHEPNFGIFRLTDPPGLETIVRCNDKSLFHIHPDLPLYTDVDADWGHCRLRDYDFEAHDLRSA